MKSRARAIRRTTSPGKIVWAVSGGEIINPSFGGALRKEWVIMLEYNNWRHGTPRRTQAKSTRARVLLIQADARHFAPLFRNLPLADSHLDVILDLLDIPLQQELIYLLRHPGGPVGRIPARPEFLSS
jgi:hypothetical protein